MKLYEIKFTPKQRETLKPIMVKVEEAYCTPDRETGGAVLQLYDSGNGARGYFIPRKYMMEISRIIQEGIDKGDI